jgi:heme-degrading monooxygenase HmoA
MKGSVMQARMAIYSLNGDAHDLARRAEEGILPLLKAQPGFKAYSVAIGDGEVLSLSVWDTRAEAEAGSEVVASWVAENMAGDIDLVSVRYSEIMFSTSLGVTTSASAA